MELRLQRSRSFRLSRGPREWVNEIASRWKALCFLRPWSTELVFYLKLVENHQGRHMTVLTLKKHYSDGHVEKLKKGKTGSNQRHIARYFCTQLRGIVPFTASAEGMDSFQVARFSATNILPNWLNSINWTSLNYLLLERSQPLRCILPTVIYYLLNVISTPRSGLTSERSSSLIFLYHWNCQARCGHSEWKQYYFSDGRKISETLRHVVSFSNLCISRITP